MATKASAQVTVVDISDSYSVFLSSEAYTFTGSTIGAPSGLTCTTQATAYCGTSQCTTVSITASAITCPTGIKATVSNNNTSSPTVTFTTTATITTSCEATIPVVVNGITINKKFSFAVAKTGATGDTGNGIKSITNYYLATSASSGVTTSTSGWTTTVQTMTATNKYLWDYEVVAFTSGSTTSAPCIIGVYGDKGAQGNKGDKGDKGDTGATGATGDTGNGISSITEYYQVSTSNSTAPTSWQTTVPTLTATNKYLWNYETITYTNGDTVDTKKRVIGVYGDKGATGATGSTAKRAGAIKASAAITAGNLIVGNSSGYHHLKTGTAFDISYGVLYAASAISSGSTGTDNYTTINFTVTATQSITLTAHKSVYIKGTLTGPTFTPISTAPLTQTVPTSSDGYFYMLVGVATSTTAISLGEDHTVYRYLNGKFQAMGSTADETVLNWCKNSDLTYIDGGKLYANSVTAAKINTTDLFSQNITATKMTITGGALGSSGWTIDTRGISAMDDGSYIEAGAWRIRTDYIHSYNNGEYILYNNYRYHYAMQAVDPSRIIDGTANATNYLFARRLTNTNYLNGNISNSYWDYLFYVTYLGGIYSQTLSVEDTIYTNKIGVNTITGRGSGISCEAQVSVKAGFEIFHATPYIDFHYGNSTADYTSRIIEVSSGTLTVSGDLAVNNHSTAIGSVVASSTIISSSIAANKSTGICKISLPAGSWILNGQFSLSGVSSGPSSGFGSINTSSSSSNNNCIQSWYSPAENTTRCNVTMEISISGTTTYYLIAYDSVYARTVSVALLRAVRVS